MTVPVSAFESVVLKSSLVPVVATATKTGTGIDRSAYGTCMMVVYLGVGASLAAGVYYTLTFEESDVVGSGYTTIASTDIDGGLSGTRVLNDATEAGQFIIRGYHGKKKYVRVVATLTGVDATGTAMAMFVALGNPLYVPATQTTEVDAA